jgi:hypothetical protein
MKLGWRYKTGEDVHHGDHVQVSKAQAKIHGAERGQVYDRYGFITVRLINGVRVDYTPRNLKFLGRGVL